MRDGKGVGAGSERLLQPDDHVEQQVTEADDQHTLEAPLSLGEADGMRTGE